MLFARVVPGRVMTISEVLNRVLIGELTAAQAAEIVAIPERSVLQWIRCRKAGLPSHVHRRTSPKKRPPSSTQLRHVVALYASSYRGISTKAFVSALRRDHEITLSFETVRLALQGAGLVGRRQKPHSVPHVNPTDVLPASTEVPPPTDGFDRSSPAVPQDSEVVRRLQHASDRVAVLNATTRDATVAWRQGRLTLPELVASYANLTRALEQAVAEIRRATR